MKSVHIPYAEDAEILKTLLKCALSGVLAYGLAQLFSTMGVLIAAALRGALLLLTGLVFTVASTIFNTALYVYANNNLLALGFKEEVVKGAFRRK